VLRDDSINHANNVSRRVIFDRTEGKPRQKKIFRRPESFADYESQI